MLKNQKGFGVVELVLIIFMCAAITATGLYIWHAHSSSNTTQSNTKIPPSQSNGHVNLPTMTGVSTDCYSMNVPQRSQNSTWNIGKTTCRICTAFQNGNLTFSTPLTQSSMTFSAALNQYKSQANASSKGDTKSVKQVKIDGNQGACLIEVFSGSSGPHDVLPANTSEQCTFVTSKTYSVQDYEIPPKTFTTNNFNLRLEVYTTNQTLFNGIANSVIDSIHWQ
jgi:hypothetical protein